MLMTAFLDDNIREPLPTRKPQPRPRTIRARPQACIPAIQFTLPWQIQFTGTSLWCVAQVLVVLITKLLIDF